MLLFFDIDAGKDIMLYTDGEDQDGQYEIFSVLMPPLVGIHKHDADLYLKPLEEPIKDVEDAIKN